MFTFTSRTIYEVNGKAQYLERFWPATNNDAILVYLAKTLRDLLSNKNGFAFFNKVNDSIATELRATLINNRNIMKNY